MGAELLLSAAAAAGCAWALTSGTGRGPRAAARLRRHRELRAALAWAGRLPGAEQALAWEPWRAVLAEACDRLRARGLPLSAPERRGVLPALCLLAACALFALVPRPWALAAGPLAALALVAPAASALERMRLARVARALPDAYRSLASALSSGKTLPQALEYVGRHASDEVGEAFGAASMELACGSSVQEAVATLGERLPGESTGLLVCALTVSQRTGAPLAGLLEEAAELLERREGLARLLKTKTAQVRLSSHVVMALPAALVAVLALLSGDYRAGIATPVGLGALLLAALMDLAALAVMRRTMKGVRT